MLVRSAYVVSILNFAISVLLLRNNGLDFAGVGAFPAVRIDGPRHVVVGRPALNLLIFVSEFANQVGIDFRVRPPGSCSAVDVVSSHCRLAGLPCQRYGMPLALLRKY